MKILSTLMIVAAIGLLSPAGALAQETIGKTGFAVGGHGAGGNRANMTTPDGPGLNSQSMLNPQYYGKNGTIDFVAECRLHEISVLWCWSHGYATR